MQTEVYLYSRRSAPPALLRRCTAAWIALVGPDVTLAERAELRSRGVAVLILRQRRSLRQYSRFFRGGR